MGAGMPATSLAALTKTSRRHSARISRQRGQTAASMSTSNPSDARYIRYYVATMDAAKMDICSLPGADHVT
jgi:hypothetical protein